MLFKKLSLGLSLSILVGLAGAFAPRHASALDIAETPLFMTAAVDPNIVFMLDDSGSMRWGFMPDELVLEDGYSASCQSYISYGGVSRTCASNMGAGFYLASPHLNKSYYDPSATYEPPLRPDGTSYEQADFNSAKVNGYEGGSCSTSNPCIDLESDYRAIMDPYYHAYGCGRGCTAYGFTVSPYGNAVPAFIYEFDQSRPGCGTDHTDNDSLLSHKQLKKKA